MSRIRVFEMSELSEDRKRLHDLILDLPDELWGSYFMVVGGVVGMALTIGGTALLVSAFATQLPKNPEIANATLIGMVGLGIVMLWWTFASFRKVKGRKAAVLDCARLMDISEVIAELGDSASILRRWDLFSALFLKFGGTDNAAAYLASTAPAEKFVARFEMLRRLSGVVELAVINEKVLKRTLRRASWLGIPATLILSLLRLTIESQFARWGGGWGGVGDLLGMLILIMIFGGVVYGLSFLKQPEDDQVVEILSELDTKDLEEIVGDKFLGRYARRLLKGHET
jgi:hypothetical protein